MALEDKVETGTLAWITIIGSVILLLVILAVEMIFAIADRSLYEKRVLADPNTAVHEQVQAQVSRISDYAKDGDKVRIPIDEAMKVTVDRYRHQ